VETPLARPVSIAIAAVGGQGGGVLSDWIVDTAEHAGFIAQATSVPGVAQRTGSTVYYLELFPRARANAAGRDPIMALMPVPGDVDVVIAGELVEAGRAMLRGFVTPDRTTLIASRHRDYALSEKMDPGDGRIDSDQVIRLATEHARRFICFDMAAAAEDTGAVISSVLLGALAGSGALPFSKAQYEESIRRSRVALESNLAGFAIGCERAGAAPATPGQPSARSAGDGARAEPGDAGVRALLERIRGAFPEPAHEVLRLGVRRLLDYQDPRYAGEYLDRLAAVATLDAARGGRTAGHPLIIETARSLALWMSYEDTLRIADLKTRAGRFTRVRREVAARPDQVVEIVDFLHPRVEEICDTLPAAIGVRVFGSTRLRRLIGWFCRGQRIRTSSLSGFLLLYMLGGLRRWRRATYRYGLEQARIERWLATLAETAGSDYELAVEVAKCQRLVKGYGETHARGLGNFNRIMDALERIRAQPQPARTLRELCAAALADEEGATLTRLMQRVA
jgi:indolepyruvate ferredoxin oxidoreductase beta subunit